MDLTVIVQVTDTINKNDLMVTVKKSVLEESGTKPISFSISNFMSSYSRCVGKRDLVNQFYLLYSQTI